MRALNVVLVLALALSLVSGGVADADELRALELELEAARTKRLYLVVDIPASTLRLELGGVSLESYPLRSLAVGRRVFTSRDIDADADALLRLYECRPRLTRKLTIITPGDPAVDVPADPPVPEEPVAPERLLLDCGPDFSLTLGRAGPSLRDRIHLLRDPDVAIRVHAALEEADLGKLSVMLPEGILLLFSLR